MGYIAAELKVLLNVAVTSRKHERVLLFHLSFWLKFQQDCYDSYNEDGIVDDCDIMSKWQNR